MLCKGNAERMSDRFAGRRFCHSWQGEALSVSDNRSDYNSEDVGAHVEYAWWYTIVHPVPQPRDGIAGSWSISPCSLDHKASHSLSVDLYISTQA